MGIKGLWEVIAPAGTRQSLRRYCLDYVHANAENPDPHMHYLRIGVDVSIIIAECFTACKAAGMNGHLDLTSGALSILFNKLAMYLTVPATFIFVFDGPERPKIKRSHKVGNVAPRWTKVVQTLVQHFGYHIHQAPGEAEAELALLNLLGRLDAIITSDGDSFVFGARTVLRSIPHKNKRFPDEVEVFTSDALQQTLNLSYGGLILFALLAGGDYDPSGITGCGSQTALALAQCRFGDQLFEAYSNQSRLLFLLELVNWRTELKTELTTNSRNMLRRRQPQIATQIDDTFPNVQIMDLYLRPRLSLAEDIPAQWLIHEPSLPNLTKFCREHFDWNTEDVLKKKFKSIIWEGTFLQMLYSPLRVYDPVSSSIVTPNTSSRILSAGRKARKGKLVEVMGDQPQPRLVISANNFISLMDPSFSVMEENTFVVWAPENFVDFLDQLS